MIRILHVVNTLSKDGGIINSIMNYYRALNKDIIQFDFLYFKEVENDHKKEITEQGGLFYKMPLLTPFNPILFYRELKKFFSFNNEKYKILHLHEILYGFVVLPLAKKYGIKKIIVHSHSVKYSNSILKSLRNQILCINLIKNANYYMACSKKAGLFLFGKGICNSNCFTILPNAFDLRKYKFNEELREKLRKEYNLVNKFVIGHIGRFSEEKNHVFLIKCFYEVYRKQNNSVLFLIGDGPLKNNIVELVNSLGLKKNVVFAGIRSDVSELLNVMDVFCFPSLFEGLGISVVEAQVNSLPVLCSDCVPSEVDIGSEIFHLQLDKKSVWINKLLAFKNYKRSTNYRLYSASECYNVLNTVKFLEEYYLKL